MSKVLSSMLGEFVDIRTGKLDANAADENGSYPFFTCSVNPLQINTPAFDCEAVLVAGNGDLNVKHYKGKFNAYQRTYVISAKNDNKIDLRYLYHFLDNHLITLREQSIGGVIKYIKIGNLTDIDFKAIPLEEQNRIAAILDTAGTIRTKRKEAISKLDQLAQSVFLEMFGDPITNEKGWIKSSLEKVGSISTGNTPPRAEAMNYGDHIEWIKSDNILADSLYVAKASEYLSLQGSKIGRIVNPGAILVVCIAGSLESIGRAALTDRRVAFNQQINSISPSNINSQYLLSCIRYGKRMFQLASTNSMKGMISKSTFAEIEIPVPPLLLQEQFAVKFEQIYNLRTMHERALSLEESLFLSLQNQAFSGNL